MENNFDELQNVINKYMSHVEIDSVHKAYYFAKVAHDGQVRKSGEPFIMHPVSVACVLAKLHLPFKVIIAALLHDVIEDTDFEYIDISENFGVDVADIVDGVTKLGAIQGLSNDFVRAENHRKIIISAAKDIRVILVKLADRVHNMRTINHMNQSKQKLIANETLEVYAPIAHRLGMYQIKWELEDLSFKCINPDAYDKIAKQLQMKRSQREKVVEDIINQALDYIKLKGLDVEIKGRSKHIYSIYQKLSKQHKHFDELTDLFAFRIIVNNIPECYTVLGWIHEKYKPIPMKFKDYIPTPKHNMYQSIHTTVMSELGFPIEFQIRTKQMDLTAEFGIASHWMYKSNDEITSQEIQEEIQERIAWLKQALQMDSSIDPRKFMDQVKLDFLSKNLIVYTPKGDVIEIPEGSTALDFAYYIHSSVGNTAVSAKVNDHVVSLFYKLNIGDIVQIITNESAQPAVGYIQKVKTSKAKEALRKYFKDAQKRQIQVEGRKLLIQNSPKQGIYNIKSTLVEFEDEIIIHFNVKNIDEFYYLIGNGEINFYDVIYYVKNKKVEVHYSSEVLINDNPELTKFRYCRYCSPVYGDEIYASKAVENFYMTKYFIHREGCLIDKQYNAKFTTLGKNINYLSRLQFEIVDKPNSVSKILNEIGNLNVNITSLFFRASVGTTAFGRISFEVSGIIELRKIIDTLLSFDNVISIDRIIDEELDESY